MRRHWRRSPARRWRARSRSPPPIRSRASTVAPSCCAGSGRRSRPGPTSSRAPTAPRPGGLFDHLAALAEGGAIAGAPHPLRVAAPPGGHLAVATRSSAACRSATAGAIPAMVTDDATSGLVPLHKLSQWLAYSLIEPLQAAGIAVTDIDGLTGLAEYRNGGLFVDTGVLALRDPGAGATRARCRIGPRRGVAGADGGPARPAGGARARAARRRCRIDAACPHPAGRDVGRGAGDRARAQGRRGAAHQGHQRRHRVLSAATGASHGRRHGRRAPAGAAQAGPDPRQGPLHQVLPRAAEGDRHAAVLRGDARPAADERRDRDADGAHHGAARSPARSWCSRRCCGPA